MSNNKKIVPILFSVVVLFSSAQVSAINLGQFNPSSWNIRGRLSALNIGFPQFLKGSTVNKKPAEIELQEIPFSQETVKETTSQNFFSKLFSRRPRFGMPGINVKGRFTRLFAFNWLKENKKPSEESSAFDVYDFLLSKESAPKLAQQHRQDDKENITSQGFFSKLFSRRPRFGMPRFNLKGLFPRLFAFNWLKRNKKSSEVSSAFDVVEAFFPEVKLQSETSSVPSNLTYNDDEIKIAEDPGELDDDIDGLNSLLEYKANLYKILCRENELASSYSEELERRANLREAEEKESLLSEGQVLHKEHELLAPQLDSSMNDVHYAMVSKRNPGTEMITSLES